MGCPEDLAFVIWPSCCCFHHVDVVLVLSKVMDIAAAGDEERDREGPLCLMPTILMYLIPTVHTSFKPTILMYLMPTVHTSFMPTVFMCLMPPVLIS